MERSWSFAVYILFLDLALSLVYKLCVFVVPQMPCNTKEKKLDVQKEENAKSQVSISSNTTESNSDNIITITPSNPVNYTRQTNTLNHAQHSQEERQSHQLQLKEDTFTISPDIVKEIIAVRNSRVKKCLFPSVNKHDAAVSKPEENLVETSLADSNFQRSESKIEISTTTSKRIQDKAQNLALNRLLDEKAVPSTLNISETSSGHLGSKTRSSTLNRVASEEKTQELYSMNLAEENFKSSTSGDLNCMAQNAAFGRLEVKTHKAITQSKRNSAFGSDRLGGKDQHSNTTCEQAVDIAQNPASDQRLKEMTQTSNCESRLDNNAIQICNCQATVKDKVPKSNQTESQSFRNIGAQTIEISGIIKSKDAELQRISRDLQSKNSDNISGIKARSQHGGGVDTEADINDPVSRLTDISTSSRKENTLANCTGCFIPDHKSIIWYLSLLVNVLDQEK